MSTHIEEPRLPIPEPADYEAGRAHPGDSVLDGIAAAEDEPPHPINWNLLTADEAEAEWLDLNAGCTRG